MSEVSSMQGLAWLQSTVVVERIGWLLIHSVWQFAAVALLAFWLDRLLRRASAATRYATLLTAMLLIVIVPIGTWQFLPSEPSRLAASYSPPPFASIEPVADRREPTADGDNNAHANAGPGGLGGAAAKVIPPPVDAAASPIVTPPAKSWRALVTDLLQPWLSAIVSAWCLGVLLFSIRPVWGWYVVRRLSSVGIAPVAETVQQAFDRMCVRLKVTQRVRVLQSTLVNAPVVVGCFRVVILLPASFIAGVPVSQLEAILAHELAHVRRYDYLVNVLQTLVETLFFYHPAVWWLSHRLRIERENSCDDLVVAALGNKIEYGRALLAVEEFRSAAVSSLALSARGGSLLARVKRLFADPTSDDQRGNAAWVAMGILFIGLAVAAWALTTANAHESPSTDDDSQAQTFVAQVTDAISVELLAVQPHSGDANEPWKPNGQAFDVRPELPTWHDTANRFEDGSRHLFFQWKGLEDAVGLTYRIPGLRLYLNRDESGIARVVAEPSDEGNVVTVRVGITDSDWGPWQKVDRGGKIIEPVEIPLACRNVYEKIKPHHIEERVNACLFCWSGLKGVDEHAESSVVAVDVNGKRREYYGRSAWNGPSGPESAEVFDIPLNDIDHFEYRLRPYRHWVKFENVSLAPGQKTDVKTSVDTISSVQSASRAGRWLITDSAELEITQQVFHATDVMTSAVIRLRGDKIEPRLIPVSIATDHFANRVRWRAVWEEGQPVLWLVTGPGDGPGRKLLPGAKVKADEIRRIDFGDPDCVVHHRYDGWVANQLPSPECRAALESEFEIKATGQESFRYFESAVAGLQPTENIEHLFVWIGEDGNCQVEDPVWEMGQPREVKCTYAALPETLALVMKKFRDKKGIQVPVYAFITARPQLPLADLRAAFAACGQAGIHAPREPGSNAASADGASRSNGPENAIHGVPFRLPDHWIVEDVRWIEDDRQLVTASLQGGVNVRRWDVAGRKLLSEIKLGSDQHGRPVRQGTIRLSADGSRAIAVTDAYVGVWDTSTGDLLQPLPIPQKQWEYDTVHCLACSTDGAVIVAGLGTSYSRTTIRYSSYGIAWDARSGAVLCTFERQGGFDVCDIAMTADGRRFATCSEGQRVCLWETSSGKLLGDYSELVHDWQSPEPELIKNHLVRGIELSADGQRLAIVGTFGIRLVDLDSGKLLRTIDSPVRFGLGDAVFSPDGQYLARFGSRRSRQEPDSVVAWSLVTGEQVHEFVAPGAIARFSSSGRQLAVGESDFYEAVSVWPMTSEKKLGPLPPPQKTARIDRVEENTHLRGASAAELAQRWPVSWGPAQQGLQYGIAMTSAGHRFRIGQRVPLVVFLKNSSDQPLQFDFRPDMFGNLPRVTNADRQSIELVRRNLLGPIAHYRDKLEPGELFGPLYLNFGLGPNPQPGAQEWTPHWSAPTPGVYRLVHQAAIHLADPKATGDTTGPDWRPGTLQTGSLEFEIVDARSGNEEEANVDPAAPSRDEAARNSAAIPVREASRGFAAGDDVTITSFARLPAGSDYGFEVRGKYQLSSCDGASLGQWCADGEVRGEKSKTIQRGEGEFHFRFTLVKPGQLHLSLYPIEGGNSFGSLYYEPVDERLQAELIGANSAAPGNATSTSWKERETPFYRLHYDASQTEDFQQLCVYANECVQNLREEFGQQRVDSLLKSAEIDIYLQPRPTSAAAPGLATLRTGTKDGIYRAELHLLAQSAHPEGAMTNIGETMDDNYFFKTLVHEYSTIVLERLTSHKQTGWRFFDAPSWFVQGYEEYLGLMLSSKHNRTIVFDKYLELHRADAQRLDKNFSAVKSDYIDGAVLIRFLHETYGKDKVQSLLVSEAVDFWSAVKAELGVDRMQLYAAWLQYRSKKLVSNQEKSDTQLPWRARGRVVDGDGKPLAGVTVRAATGVGTLLGGGSGVTGEDGRYDFRFGMGVMFGDITDAIPDPQTQYALISARLAGHFEQNFSRHGNGIASLSPVISEDLKHWGVKADQVCLPDKPRELNFVMLPAAKVSGTLIGEDDQPLQEYSVFLTAEELPPGSSVLAQVRTDENGRFKVTEIPTTIPYQFEVRKPRAELKPPWDDSWASPPLTFAEPGENDLQTRLKSPQVTADRLTVKSLRLKIVGAGVHGKTAAQRALQRPLAVAGATLSAKEILLNEWTITLSNEADTK